MQNVGQKTLGKLLLEDKNRLKGNIEMNLTKTGCDDIAEMNEHFVIWDVMLCSAVAG